MKLKLRYYVILTILLCFGSLFLFQASQAFPALPSSFYGTIQNDGTNVQPGTSIKAMIENQVFAEGETQMYEGKSVYTLTVPGDDNDTPEMDGGREGDQIFFEISGLVAEQTGVWQSGTNVELNLTASSNPNQSELENTPTPSASEDQPEIADQPAATPIPQIPTATAVQVEIPIQSPGTATIIPSSSLQADNTPNQIEQSMFETAVFENEEPNLSKTPGEPQDLQPDITSTESSAATPEQNSQRNLLIFLTPFRLFLGIGAVAVVVGIAFWIRANRK